MGNSVTDQIINQLNESIFDGYIIFEINKYPKIIYLDDKLLEILDYSKEELFRKDGYKLIHEKFKYKTREEVYKNEIKPFAIGVIGKSGEEHSIEITGKNISIDKINYLIFGIKLIDGKELQKELLLKILEGDPNFIQIIDNNYNIVYMNKPPIERDVIGTSILQFMDKENIPLFKSKIDDIFKTKKTDNLFLKSKDGMMYYNQLVPIIINNIVQQVIQYSIDISEIETLKISLKEERFYYQQLLNSIPDIIITVDRDMNIMEWMGAAERIHGYAREEILGKNVSILYHKHKNIQNEIAIANLIKDNDRNHSVDITAVNKNGKTQIINIKISNLLNNDGIMIAMIIIGRDVTKIREEEVKMDRLREKMQQRAKLESLGILAGGVAHDFNNLFLNILGNASLIKNISKSDEITELIDEIITVTRQSAELSNLMLSLSGKSQLKIVTLQINDIINEIKTFIVSSIPKRIKIIFELHKDLPLVNADIAQMNQLIINLITNASEAIKDKGKIIIKTHINNCEIDSKPAVCIEVSDTGIGMSKETIKRIFDPFYSSKKIGRGLGLSIVDTNVNKMGGSINVTSEINKGSTFLVKIPVSNKLITDHTLEEGFDYNPINLNVMICDDEQFVLDVLHRMLKTFNSNEIKSVKSGIECYNEYKKYPDKYDVIILDLSMPGELDGKQTATKILELNKKQKILFTSGYTVSEIEDFMKKDNIDFIQKPYDVKLFYQIFHKFSH